ncbi:hypothetical protein TPA0906_66600 [Streptomyces olivaceus]|uniref:hypothetical protein n=1 Tax=Streptomyces olivaceus TaxID=47716 RepID=UPI0022EE7391|nr:hypothetical protein [Streptomyces olivaceus]GHJ04795.1 hypothetical protein TPA0906_66600 [Streptomyces olivaceus]
MQATMNPARKTCFTCYGTATNVMTQEGSEARYLCADCLRTWRQLGAVDDWTIEAVDPEPAVEVEVAVHIRQRIARKRGNGFYKVQYGPSENGSRTLCGAPASQDISWADGRFAKYLAYVTCDECKRLRNS